MEEKGPGTPAGPAEGPGEGMRIESSVTSISWIPSAAIAGATRIPFEAGVAHYDDPPPDEWKDLAIEYMRVVSGFPTSQNAGTALLKVGEIHETLKEPETALKIYTQVAREHANTPLGQAAQKNVERLKGPARAGG